MVFNTLYRSLRADFLQKVRAVVTELEAWNEDELFYRRWYELRHDEKALAAFLNSLGPGFLKKKNLITPEYIEQNKTGDHLSEDRLFAAQDSMFQNVLFYKRPRYLPSIKHKHEFFEGILVLRGQCTNTIADKNLVLCAGNLCFIAPETYHMLEVFDDDSIVLYILIRHRTFDEVFANLLPAPGVLAQFFMRNIWSKTSEYLVFNIANDTEILEQLLTMLVEQNVGDEESDRIIEFQLVVFFYLLKRKYGNSPVVHEQVGLKEKHAELIAYIIKHFRTLSHAALSAKFNLSAAYCSRIIKSITGKNFVTLVHELRMNHARVMLLKSDAKIYDISFSLGYENQETFIRNFKKAHGITPGQYRKNHAV